MTDRKVEGVMGDEDYQRGRREAFVEIREAAIELRDTAVELDGPDEWQHVFRRAQAAFCEGMLRATTLLHGGRTAARAALYAEVDRERSRQDSVHGAQLALPVFSEWPAFGTERNAREEYEIAKARGTLTHAHIILEESAEAWQAHQAGDHAGCRREMVEALTCWVKAIEAHDAQHGGGK